MKSVFCSHYWKGTKRLFKCDVFEIVVIAFEAIFFLDRYIHCVCPLRATNQLKGKLNMMKIHVNYLYLRPFCCIFNL
jgi:hypothetical protein